MALHGEIKVNGLVIGHWEAQRQSLTLTHPDKDEVLTYCATVSLNSSPDGCPARFWHGEVQHRFGDGALGLMATVLRKGSMMTELKP